MAMSAGLPTPSVIAHNTNTGMTDYRSGAQLLETMAKARQMYSLYADIVDGLRVNSKRSLAEVDADYSTMTEVADTLLRHAEVPFRVGHHYASEITEYGRANGKRPKDLTPDELRHLYEEAYGEELPVDVALIQAALDPEEMVASRRGLGGPQPEEVSRMLRTHRDKVDASRRWLTATRTKLSNAQDALTSAFARLVGSAG